METLSKIYKGVNYTEEWKPIKGYEGIYEISSFGRVKSLDRQIKENSGKIRFKKGKLLALSINTRGYLFTSLSKNSKIKSFTTHKLVSIAFLNHIPSGMTVVIDHLNNNKLDNFYKNLKQTSQRENTSRYKKSNLNNSLGVTKNGNNYRSSVFFNGSTLNLGVFKTQEEASEYYQNALKSIEKGEEIIVKRATYTSNQKGVSFNKLNNKWVVQIKHNSKQVRIGEFFTEQEAIKIYKNSEKEIQMGKELTIYTNLKKYTSKYKGVCWCKIKNKWRVYAKKNSKSIHIGYFINEEEAYNAREEYLKLITNK